MFLGTAKLALLSLVSRGKPLPYRTGLFFVVGQTDHAVCPPFPPPHHVPPLPPPTLRGSPPPRTRRCAGTVKHPPFALKRSNPARSCAWMGSWLCNVAGIVLRVGGHPGVSGDSDGGLPEGEVDAHLPEVHQRGRCLTGKLALPLVMTLKLVFKLFLCFCCCL